MTFELRIISQDAITPIFQSNDTNIIETFVNPDNAQNMKARREVDNVVEGQYDQQQKKGFLMRK